MLQNENHNEKIVSILLSFVTVMSISSVTAFATETKFNRYEQIRYLNDEERYDFIWKSFTYGQSNELAECEKMTTYLLCQ